MTGFRGGIASPANTRVGVGVQWFNPFTFAQTNAGLALGAWTAVQDLAFNNLADLPAALGLSHDNASGKFTATEDGVWTVSFDGQGGHDTTGYIEIHVLASGDQGNFLSYGRLSQTFCQPGVNRVLRLAKGEWFRFLVTTYQVAAAGTVTGLAFAEANIVRLS